MMSERRIAGIRARKTIYNLVENNPGLHLKDISRRTNMPKSTVKYHIEQLCKQNLLDVKNSFVMVEQLLIISYQKKIDFIIKKLKFQTTIFSLKML